MYTPNADLLEYPDITELVSRIQTLPANSLPQEVEAEAEFRLTRNHPSLSRRHLMCSVRK